MLDLLAHNGLVKTELARLHQGNLAKKPMRSIQKHHLVLILLLCDASPSNSQNSSIQAMEGKALVTRLQDKEAHRPIHS